MVELGRLLVAIGFSILFVGLIILIAAKYIPWLGNLPGDFRFERENYQLYFPLATMILISILGTILLNLIIRIFRR